MKTLFIDLTNARAYASIVNLREDILSLPEGSAANIITLPTDACQWVAPALVQVDFDEVLEAFTLSVEGGELVRSEEESENAMIEDAAIDGHIHELRDGQRIAYLRCEPLEKPRDLGFQQEIHDWAQWAGFRLSGDTTISQELILADWLRAEGCSSDTHFDEDEGAVSVRPTCYPPAHVCAELLRLFDDILTQPA